MKLQRRHQRIAPPAPDRLPAVIESLLFVAEEPQEIGALAKSVGVSRERVERALETLTGSVDGRGLFVQRLGDRVQLATVPDAAPYIERLLEVSHGRLSRAALETLAIIAYRQPVTRATIESIRGVNSDGAVATLVARELVHEVGRAPGPGRPLLFGTTVRFMEYFGLQRMDDLPPLPPMAQDDGLSAPAAAANGAYEATESGEEALDGSAADEPGVDDPPETPEPENL
jgi:segregation and condensation protein B